MKKKKGIDHSSTFSDLKLKGKMSNSAHPGTESGAGSTYSQLELMFLD